MKLLFTRRHHYYDKTYYWYSIQSFNIIPHNRGIAQSIRYSSIIINANNSVISLNIYGIFAFHGIYIIGSAIRNLRFCALLTSWRTRGAACRYGSCSSRRNCCVRWWKSPSSAREGSSMVTSRSLIPNVSFASIPTARHLRKYFTMVLQPSNFADRSFTSVWTRTREFTKQPRKTYGSASAGFTFNLEESVLLDIL